MGGSVRSLFVMDPLDRIHVEGDSTYVLMRESTDRGYPVWCCTPDDLFARDGRGAARATPVRTTATAPFFHTGPPVDMDFGELDVVWMRKDPPFDMRYILATYLLDMAPESTLVINGPTGLKLFNEKLWVQARWPELQPPTLLSSAPARLREFVAEQPGRVVLKPWDGNGGRGVLVTDAADRNLNAMLDLLTHEGREHVLAQGYIRGVENGDKRIILIDGEPVGAVNRVPAGGDHRANMHVGATIERTELDASEREICAALAPELRRWDMVFVGIDVIGGMLTEINVTSPTGIREINVLDDVRLEVRLLDTVEHRLGGEN